MKVRRRESGVTCPASSRPTWRSDFVASLTAAARKWFRTVGALSRRPSRVGKTKSAASALSAPVPMQRTLEQTQTLGVPPAYK